MLERVTGEIKIEQFIHIMDLAQDLNGDLVVTTTSEDEYRYDENKKFKSRQRYKSPIALADKFLNNVNDQEICKVVSFAKKYYAVFLDNFKYIRIYDKNCNFIRYQELYGTEPDITVLSNGDLV